MIFKYLFITSMMFFFMKPTKNLHIYRVPYFIKYSNGISIFKQNP